MIKKLLLEGHGYGTLEKKLFSGGILKNYLIEGKNSSKEYIVLWQKLVNLKSQLSAKELLIKQQESSESRRPLKVNVSVTKIDDSKIIQLDSQIKILYNEIDNLVLNEYIKESNKSAYSHLLKILWSLKNNIVLSEILRGLIEMSNKGSSIEALFLYHYAKRQVAITLNGYYF